jgi:hypothetical protein
VQYYINKFCELIGQLQAYSPNTDSVYYTTHFIDGLRDEIKHVILVQRPQTWIPSAAWSCCRRKMPTGSQGILRRLTVHWCRSHTSEVLYLYQAPSHAKIETVVEDKSKQAGHKVQSMED